MFNTLLVFLGCGVGGVFRYWIISLAYTTLGREFPHGTLFVNVTGSFLMGFLVMLIQEKFIAIDTQMRLLLLVGFLGGYTTFSSFSMDTLNLIEAGRYISAIGYTLGSVLLCLVSIWAGVLLGKLL